MGCRIYLVTLVVFQLAFRMVEASSPDKRVMAGDVVFAEDAFGTGDEM